MAKKAVAKRGSTDVVSIEEQLRREREAMAERVGGGESAKIKLTDKVFTMPDGGVNEGPMEAVVVDFVSKNAFYDGQYDPRNPRPPICFAIGTVLADMAPSPNSPEPQAEQCSTCPNNQFGSAGDGKACKNSRVLAVLPPEADEETTINVLEVSPTGLKSFDKFIKDQINNNRSPVEVVVDIDFHPERSYPSLVFSASRGNENLARHFVRRQEAQKIITEEPDLSSFQPESTPAPRAAPKRRTRARAKAAR